MPKQQLLLIPLFHIYCKQGLDIAHATWDIMHYIKDCTCQCFPFHFSSRILDDIFRHTQGEGGIYTSPLLYQDLRKQVEVPSTTACIDQIPLSALLELLRKSRDLKEVLLDITDTLSMSILFQNNSPNTADLCFLMRISKFEPSFSLKPSFFLYILSKKASVMQSFECKNYMFLSHLRTIRDVAQQPTVLMQRNHRNEVFQVKNLDMMLDWQHLTG